MKAKIIFIFLCILILGACSTQEQKNISELEKFTNELQENSSTYTNEEWSASMDEFQILTQSIETGHYTQEERRELGRLKGKCLGIYAKHSRQLLESEIEGVATELEGAFDGFMEVLEGL
jgi:hypothetical protein